MFARLRLLSLLSSSLVACAVAGCAIDPSVSDDADDGDGDGSGLVGDSVNQSEDQLLSEHQLTGSELPDKTVALTFDDGPGPRTIELVDYLASQGIPATFFLNGKNVPGHQDRVDAIVNRGMILANHTQNHLQLTHLSASKLLSEVTLTDDIIKEAQPDGPFLLRAPYGAMNGTVTRTLNRTEQSKYVGSIFWDIGGELTSNSAADWDCWGKHVTVERCGELYLQEIHRRKHGIILMHDIHSHTIDMVKTVVVPQLIADGYKFASLPEVPSIKRALENNGAGAGDADDGSCSSATLGKTMPETTCVQSRNDQKWYVCAEGEWDLVPGSSDARCAGQKYPLAP
jgi:peptidoglycan/xylan/chitin deacetylase (PgdA/CDA1 family)